MLGTLCSLWLSLFPFGRRSLRNFAGESFQLSAVEHGVVHHAEHKLLGGSAAEAVDNVLYRPDRDVLARVRGSVDEGSPFYLMGDVSLIFQAAQNRADGRILHRP